ncbi:MAG: sigma-70 family RNA polymerase sigma factor [Acidimicrobiia bacterium]|nr:sigma-70 family RNA polymerase sigma factor [Acidimicrobiia bacterium]MBT8194204.1 sigma-70 family RNA polymerase sigma factor [Acidimicrobiia bacterium]MBT8248149.1 sigma-70 family RNA polymerase sigma factor [Acidimicrobiia bacterium]NNJ46387.1 sigma-70 family RNA polymerase sigma factor [Acidimicrobiia bacterium]NNL13402.1 sigma-70 family RNA polymerase sigma factor [Acidimicrobiia bacterium]
MKEAIAASISGGLTLVRSGEAEFRMLYDRHYDAIHSYFLRRTDTSSAPDLTAEVFLVAWRRIDDVPRGEDTLLWLYGVAANMAAHHRRSSARGARLETRLRSVPSNGTEEPEPQVVRRAEYDQVLAATARLRPADQEILRLAAWEELPHDQISRLLGCSVAAVDQRIHRAKKRLAKEFARVHMPGRPQTEEGGRR